MHLLDASLLGLLLLGAGQPSPVAFSSDGRIVLGAAPVRAIAEGEHPSWSPDGAELVYARSRPGGRRGLYIVGVHGSAERRIVTHGQDETIDDADQFDPVWSPVGDTILYTSMRSGSADLWSTNTIGHHSAQITDSPAYEGQASWSPDGRSLAFVSDRDGNDEVYVMNYDGSGVRRLTSDGAKDDQPAWSPEGRRIAFVSDRSGRSSIYTMGRDGSDVGVLTSGPGSDSAPGWSSDGRSVRFARTVNGQATVDSVPRDGGSPIVVAPAGVRVSAVVEPPRVDLAVQLSMPAAVRVGAWARIRVTVVNRGPAAASSVAATVSTTGALRVRAERCAGSPFCTRAQPLGAGGFTRTLFVRASRCGSFSLAIRARALQQDADASNDVARRRVAIPCR